jgi:hypothetical protein
MIFAFTSLYQMRHGLGKSEVTRKRSGTEAANTTRSG